MDTLQAQVAPTDGGVQHASEIIDGLMDHMESEELAEDFALFVGRASMTDMQIDMADEDDDDFEGMPFAIIAEQDTFEHAGGIHSGIRVEIWPEIEEDDSVVNVLPLHYPPERHKRFLRVENELIVEMLIYPSRTLH